MKKIAIGVDYSNICKDYNTSYLDRDNNDPATSKCMKQILKWTKEFLTELLEKFPYKLNALSSNNLVAIDDIASKRFLFYSLEKEITLQSYVLQTEYKAYENLATWERENQDGVLVKNDADGEGIHFCLIENSLVHQWIVEKLKNFSLDTVPFQAKAH